MEETTALANQKSIGWKLLLGFNVFVLVLFWLGALTDYSWFNDGVSAGYSILVLCVCMITFIMLRFLRKFLLIPILLFCILSFLAASFSILVHRYHSDQTPIQVAYSPDSTRFIEVYCGFVDAHVNGFDHIEIIARYKKFPFLQRDLGLYNNEPRHCDSDTDTLIRWEDSNTIYVVGRQAYLSVDTIKGEGSLFNPGAIDGTR